MEKHDLNLISKKRRIDTTITGDIPNLIGEGSSKVVESVSTTKPFVGSVVYKLYFKGLVSDETTADKKKIVKAGFGVAICDEADNLLYEMKESLNDITTNQEEVEIMALINGLNDSILLGLSNVVICCDDHQIYQMVSVSFPCYLFFFWLV